MVMKASEKIIEGLTQLIEGFVELQENVEEEFGAELDTEPVSRPSSEISLEMEAAIVTELRAALEIVMDSEDFATDEMAAMVSSLSDALEEIDPDVFEDSSEDEDEVYSDDDLDDEIYDDLEDDDLESLEDLEEDEYEDEDEEEEDDD